MIVLASYTWKVTDLEEALEVTLPSTVPCLCKIVSPDE